MQQYNDTMERMFSQVDMTSLNDIVDTFECNNCGNQYQLFVQAVMGMSLMMASAVVESKYNCPKCFSNNCKRVI